MNKQSNKKTVSGSKDADKTLVRNIREVVSITDVSLPKDLTDGSTIDYIEELRIALRAIACAQLEIGKLKKSAGQHLTKVRQEKVQNSPGSKKVMVPSDDLEAFNAWKALRESEKEEETST